MVKGRLCRELLSCNGQERLQLLLTTRSTEKLLELLELLELRELLELLEVLQLLEVQNY